MLMLPLVLLAGGLATRLRPLTHSIPKSLLEVAGEPFIAHQLRLFRRKGVGRVIICAGYLGSMIEDFVGDGTRFGLSVVYSFDGKTLLGTGGALRKAWPLLGHGTLVAYGDSWLDADYAAITSAFLQSDKKGLMTVFRNENAWDSSNVEFDGSRIVTYSKRNKSPSMQYIDWGLGALGPGALEGWENVECFDLADLYSGLVEQSQLVGYEVKERFYEIGSTEGLIETNALLNARSTIR
jgi:N-acetyl-alpha-D-muramate 1-phosphate uridylyltransferase